MAHGRLDQQLTGAKQQRNGQLRSQLQNVAPSEAILRELMHNGWIPQEKEEGRVVAGAQTEEDMQSRSAAGEPLNESSSSEEEREESEVQQVASPRRKKARPSKFSGA